MDTKADVFEVLNALDVSAFVEKKKSGQDMLSYLSWASAWGFVRKRYPDATFRVLRFGEDNVPYQYDPHLGYMVWTEVTIEGETHQMFLPVMDNNNKTMKAEPYEYTTKFGTKQVAAATYFDVNKNIMRCLVKNLALFGIGLSLYVGEDLPVDFSDPVPVIDLALAEVNKATDADGLTAAWKRWSAQLSNDKDGLARLKDAVKKHPANPKARKDGTDTK